MRAEYGRTGQDTGGDLADNWWLAYSFRHPAQYSRGDQDEDKIHQEHTDDMAGHRRPS
ncbi:hypothetical protein [Nocardia gipuzkoensis]|uniref:hypothetical protein n=1 Tax=Nocardia gipuzkoensis TaxID=2749991 RepID=UPI003EE27FF4